MPHNSHHSTHKKIIHRKDYISRGPDAVVQPLNHCFNSFCVCTCFELLMSYRNRRHERMNNFNNQTERQAFNRSHRYRSLVDVNQNDDYSILLFNLIELIITVMNMTIVCLLFVRSFDVCFKRLLSQNEARFGHSQHTRQHRSHNKLN